MPFPRIMRRLWPPRGQALGSPSDAELPQEVPCTWYDDAYTTRPTYQAHYTQSPYYFLWTVLVDRLRRDRVQRVLEVGCGPGQLAEFMLDQGVAQYVGFDFSKIAIEIASRRGLPNARFMLADATTTNIYTEVEHDAIVCTEVLEHVVEDLLVISRFRQGSRCICTVPSFPYRSHVRHFESAADVATRYERFFGSLDIYTLRRADSSTGAFYLFDGIRNAELWQPSLKIPFDHQSA